MGFPMSVVMQARRLVAAGWTAEETSRILAREGVTVSGRSIRRWTCEKAHQRDNERVRRAQGKARARTANFRLSSNTPEYRAAFVCRLRAEGVSKSSIVKVCTVVFGDQWSLYRVDEVLKAATS